jgi:crossover junction endodeoxyribonuclease RuvC
MVILGIDPGYAKLGYALIKKNKKGYKIIESSLIETSSDVPNEKRLFVIGNSIQKIITKHKPKAIAVEKLFFAKNQKTALRVSEIRGVILYLAAASRIPCFDFTPLEIKTAICGYGRADKKQIQEMVKITLKLKSAPKQDDVADAIAISLTCFLIKKIDIAKNPI